QIADFPTAASISATTSRTSTGLLLPILCTRQGALLDAGSGPAPLHAGSGPGGRSINRTTASTTSSTYVKSRCILPLLNNLIGRPSKMADVNSHIAISGRPQGP